MGFDGYDSTNRGIKENRAFHEMEENSEKLSSLLSISYVHTVISQMWSIP